MKIPGSTKNGWLVNLEQGWGDYGTNYSLRAAAAFSALGAVLPHPAFQGQPRSLLATLGRRSAPVATTSRRIPKLVPTNANGPVVADLVVDSRDAGAVLLVPSCWNRSG